MASQNSYNVQPFSKEEDMQYKKIYTKDVCENVHIEGYALAKHFLTHAEDNVRKMPLRHNDVFVASFPRSGTTWTQELVWLVGRNLDFDKAKAEPLVERFPFIEYYMFFDDTTKANLPDSEEMRKMFEVASIPAAQFLAKLPKEEPRFIKTHLPLCLLPDGALDTTKVVYVARDPRDVAVSCYHFFGAMDVHGIICDFKTFYYENFTKGLTKWSPYFKHVKEAWAKRNHPNLLFIFYEELSKDLKGTAKKVSKFLGKEYTEEQYDMLCDHLQFDNFKKNKSVDQEDLTHLAKNNTTNFIRKGKAGGWRDYFDAEMAAHAQRWIQENLRDTDLTFPQ